MRKFKSQIVIVFIETRQGYFLLDLIESLEVKT